jgi:integrase
MTRARQIFRFGFDEGLIITPVRFGKGFELPSKDAIDKLREARRDEHGDRMFEAAEIRQLLSASGQPLKTMVLLAANCGFGQTDLSNLPTRAVNLDAGWIDFARVKTAVRRRCPLWPETVAAIREWLADRPKAKDPADAGLLFLTCRGARWVKLNAKGTPDDAIGKEFVKVLDNLKLKRPGVSFYALRHGFETIGGETADQVAVNHIMGHKTPGISAAYRERIGDERLRRVVEHVRQWLFAEAPVADPPENGDPPRPAHENTRAQTSAVDPRPALRLYIAG